jgi:hypothetical protein
MPSMAILIRHKKMSTFETHCQESTQLFGKPYEQVHQWLDEFHGTAHYRTRHRRVRHHEAGIKEVIRLWGEEAGAVAKQHIVSDLKEEGWTKHDPFPQDEAHYVKMGLF